MLATALVALAAIDPCGAKEAERSPDPSLSEIYRRVGDAELAERSEHTAAEAYALALRWDEGNEAARLVLRRLCDRRALAAAIAEAAARMDAGDWRGAAELLQQARARQAHASAGSGSHPERPEGPAHPEPARALPRLRPGQAGSAIEDESHRPSAALLEGICWFELGDDARAAAALEEALPDADLEPAAGALLGLVHLRQGRSREAEWRLSALESGNSALRSTAAELLRLAAREGGLVLTGQLGGGLDTNPTLAPGAQVSFPGAAEGAAAVAATALWRPLGASGPYARSAAGARWLARSRTHDWAGAMAAAGVQLGDRAGRLSAEYSFDGLLFGAEPYSYAHSLRGRALVMAGPVLISAEYAGRLENFVAPAAAGESGPRHDGLAALVLPWPNGFAAEFGYGLIRDSARQSELAYLEHGPRAQLSVAQARARASAAASVGLRSYDGHDADLGVTRKEARLEGQLRGEVDLSARLSLWASVEAARVWANEERLSHDRVAALTGVAFTAGLW